MSLAKALLLLALSSVALSASTHNPKETLIWEDNFDGLDEGRWRHLVSAWSGGNQEFVYYRNVRKNR